MIRLIKNYPLLFAQREVRKLVQPEPAIEADREVEALTSAIGRQSIAPDLSTTFHRDSGRRSERRQHLLAHSKAAGEPVVPVRNGSA